MYNFLTYFLRSLKILMCLSLFQDSTIKPLGLQLSVKIEDQGPTFRPAKKQVIPFMQDLIFPLAISFAAHSSISIAFVQSPTLNIENAATPPSPSLQSRLQVEQVKYEIIEKPPAIAVEVQINICTCA